MDQTLSQYRIFYTVANEGNISRAAKALYISQPAISKSIRKLEEALGITLFSRNSRGVQLTEEGELLYRHVKTAFDALSAGEEHLRQITELGMGHLRIGVSTTLCKYILLPYLKDFIAAHPHIRISIECQSTNHTLQLLQEGQIDIGLIGKPYALKPFQFHSLGAIEDIFVATQSYLDNLNLRTDPDKQNFFSSATLMLLDKENMTRRFIDHYLKENRIEPNTLLEVSTMDLLIEFAKIGLGCGCVIREFVQKELADGSLVEVPLPAPIPRREIGFSYPATRHPGYALKTFLDFFLKNPAKRRL